MNSGLSRIAGRVIRQLKVAAFGHIFNWPWKDRIKRRQTRFKATQEATLGYLDRYLPFIGGLRPDDATSSAAAPERAFTIWLQGEENAPAVVKSCLASMRRHLQMELVVLDEKSLFNWVDLPDYVVDKWKTGKMRAAHFCDICRIDLLYRHGGVWLDSTDFVTSPVPQWIMDEDFFMFMAGTKVRESYSYVQNCFIRSKRKSPLISMWREAVLHYWKHENTIVNYFAHQLLFMMLVKNNQAAAAEFERYPHVDQDPTHALWSPHKGEPFDPVLYREITEATFFQKTEYKSLQSRNPSRGSLADMLINHSEVLIEM